MNRSLVPSAVLILLLSLSVPSLFAGPGASGAAVPTPAPPAAKEVGPAFPMAHVPAGEALVLRKGSRLWVRGSTDKRSFELWAGTLLGSAILNAPLGAGVPDALLAEVRRQGVQAMTLRVPIVGLQASDPEVETGSDYALAGPYKTLQAKDNPSVEFRLGKAKLGKEVRPGVYSLQAPGELSIAGASLDIPLKGEAVFSGGQVRVTGHYEVRLSAFKVKILEDVWGSMGPKPSVEVYFDVTFGPPPAP
ncbi:MAG TPA: hypothetical protein VMV05_09385 [bacterium]|nr:hypothetical protein [bacterium]